MTELQIDKFSPLQSLDDLMTYKLNNSNLVWCEHPTDLIMKIRLHSSSLLRKTAALGCHRVRARRRHLASLQEIAGEFLETIQKSQSHGGNTNRTKK